MINAIRITGALIGAVIGMAVHGAVGAAIGAGAGALAGTYAATDARRRMTGFTSIYLTTPEKREIRKAMAFLEVATWGVKPLAEINGDAMDRMNRRIFDEIMDPYVCKVTPQVGELMRHQKLIARAGVKPVGAFRQIRRSYSPRLGKRRDAVPVSIGLIMLRAQRPEGAIAEMRDWFLRWCEEMGIGHMAHGMWAMEMGEELTTLDAWENAEYERQMTEWNAQRAA